MPASLVEEFSLLAFKHSRELRTANELETQRLHKRIIDLAETVESLKQGEP